MKMECPNCGGNIVYILNTDFVYCEHCNQKVEVSRVNISEFSKYVEKIKEDRIKNDTGKNSYIEKLVSNNESQEVMKSDGYIYQCSKCKSEFVHSFKMKEKSCPFCSADAKTRIGESKNYLVSKILPFKVTKKSISNIICNCIESYEYSPEKIFATYVPFKASYDSVEAQGFLSQGFDKKEFSINENIITLKYIGKSINTKLAEQCLDFDFSKLEGADNISFGEDVVLDNAILEDKDVSNTKDKIVDSLNHDLYVKEGLNSQKNNYDDLKIENIKEEIWLLPIYIYRDYFRGKYRTLLINGQNGKITGEAVSRSTNKARDFSALLTFCLLVFAFLIREYINILFGLEAFWIIIAFILINGILIYLFRFKTIRNVESKGFTFYGITWNKDLKIN